MQARMHCTHAHTNIGPHTSERRGCRQVDNHDKALPAPPRPLLGLRPPGLVMLLTLLGIHLPRLLCRIIPTHEHAVVQSAVAKT